VKEILKGVHSSTTKRKGKITRDLEKKKKKEGKQNISWNAQRKQRRDVVVITRNRRWRARKKGKERNSGVVEPQRKGHALSSDKGIVLAA